MVLTKDELKEKIKQSILASSEDAFDFYLEEYAKGNVDVHNGFGTTAIHGGQEHEPTTGAVTVPISLATTFAQSTPGLLNGTELSTSFGKGFEYSRTGNPTRGAFEKAVASCEKAKYGIAFASGMAATMSILHMFETGSHIIVMDDLYGGTQRYFRRVAAPCYGLNFSFVDCTNPENVANAITDKTKLIWLETPTNPTLKVSDIEAISNIARAKNVMVAVDNTFLSPYFQNPLTNGADIVMHSVTKYINGHSDVVMGMVCTSSDEIFEKLKFIQNGVGAVPSPFDCYLALRGLKTLHLRMNAAMKNAMTIANFLESHDFVDKVIYPGLKSHPQYELAKRQHTNGPGAMITFYTKGDITNARKFLETLSVFTLAESLGAVESLAESPAIMTHASVPEEQRRILGISDSLIRLSVGVESIQDLLNDLGKSLLAASTA